jgi:hypothetical protein
LAQEGVFRISPSKAEIDGVKARLDSLGIQGMSRAEVATIIGENNVFLACALLKDWLRSLSEAVIPTRPHYAAAIAIVKKEAAQEAAEAAAAAAATANASPLSPDGPATAAARRGTTMARGGAALSASMSASLSSFLSGLPTVSQRVLSVLADLVREVTADEVQKTNKMTVRHCPEKAVSGSAAGVANRTYSHHRSLRLTIIWCIYMCVCVCVCVC